MSEPRTQPSSATGLLGRIDAVVGALGVAILGASTLLIGLNVFSRYAVHGWLRELTLVAPWTEGLYRPLAAWLGAVSVTADELPGLLLVWIAFLGAYLALRQGGHIGFGLMVERLPAGPRRIARGAVDLLLLGFMALVLLQSLRMIRVDGATEIETAEIAQGWFMAVLPLSMGLMILAVLARAVSRWRGGD